jgi:hypothetical protein
MSNIVPFDSAVPAHLANRVGKPSALAASVSGGISLGADYARISIKGGRFRIVEDGAETVLPETTLSVVIVGANPRLSKAWYAAAWNKDTEATGPDCYTHEGTRPAADSPNPQNDLCASCPQNAWGSKVTDNGTKIKACADSKRLAIVASEDPSGTKYLLNVTAAALKGLNQYQKELQMRGIAPEIVRTIVSFDTNASFPKLTFGFGGFLSAEDQAVVDTLFDSEGGRKRKGEKGGDTETTPAVTQPAEPVAQPAPAQPDPAPEPAPEPATVSTFGKPKAETKPAPEPEPEPAAASTFGKPKEAAKPTPEPEPEPAATAKTSAAAALADEISALMNDVADDA